MPRSASDHQPCILDVFKCVTIPIPVDGDRVEAILQLGRAVARDPDLRNMLDLAPLLPGDRLAGVTIAPAGARLHFDKGNDARAARDNIDFLAIHAIAALDDAPAGLEQIVGGQGFTEAA